MSHSNEWCSKKQVSKVIDRTERTVSRVVRDAVESRAEDILANLKLVYASGKEIPGPEVTRELLAKNEKEGSRTRWFFRTAWWRDDYATRMNSELEADLDSDQPGTAGGQPEGRGRGDAATSGDPPPLPADPTVRAVVLEHLHFSDQKHAAELRELTDRVLQVVETNQQLQGQSNTLYNQFQDALKAGGGLRALVESASDSQPSDQMPSAKPDASDSKIVDIEPQQTSKPRPRVKGGNAARQKPKKSASAVKATNDPFPAFRKIARYLRRK